MLKEYFLKYLQFEKNYSEKTVVSYGIDLSGFEAYFKAVDETLDFATADADVIRGWVVSLMDEGFGGPCPKGAGAKEEETVACVRERSRYGQIA